MRLEHDAPPPPCWPAGVAYLTRARLSPTFPPALLPLLLADAPAPAAPAAPSTCAAPPAPPAAPRRRFAPQATPHPPGLAVRRISTAGHPAHGQLGLFARHKIAPRTFVMPYLGIIHASYIDDDGGGGGADGIGSGDGVGVADGAGRAEADPHAASDYDLSLVRLSAADGANPTGRHVSLGVDAARAGNAARFVNDYRGVARAPNAEFRAGRGAAGERRVEIWTTAAVGKGDELLVSYGKAWWGARSGG